MGEPDVLTASEVRALLAELPEPCRTMALIAALAGLRVSEILGLQWHDVDLESAVIHLRSGNGKPTMANLLIGSLAVHTQKVNSRIGREPCSDGTCNRQSNLLELRSS